MNILELVDRFRIKADDKASPYKWPTEDVVVWFAEAEEEACERGRAIADDRTIALDAPSAPTLAATTGTLDDGTYSYLITATNASGETEVSSATTLAVSAGAGSNGVTITWTAVTGAVNYKIYGRASGSELLIATVSEATLTYTDTGSVTPAGAQPASNTTEDVVKISVTSGRVHYPVHTSIIEITKAYLLVGTVQHDLKAMDRKVMDTEFPDWRNTSEMPKHYIYDDEGIRLGYTPTTSYTLRLEVRRKPLSPMTSYVSTVEPEIDIKHHRHLVDYVLWQAYECRDIDKYSPKRAEKHEAMFTRYFGYTQTSKHRRPQELNRSHRVRCHW